MKMRVSLYCKLPVKPQNGGNKGSISRLLPHSRDYAVTSEETYERCFNFHQSPSYTTSSHPIQKEFHSKKAQALILRC